MFTHQIHDDENLLEIYRKHELTLVPKILQVFILIFIPWFLGLKYNFVFSSSIHTEIFLVWTILVAIFTIHIFLIWSINVYMVTTKRLLHIAHTGLFQKLVSETPLDRILNVSFRTTGLFSTIFRYGDVLVQIVGLDHPLVLKDVPNPVQVKDFIWKMHLEYGGDQKITYTQPEIAPVDKHIPYAPHIEGKIIVKKKRDV
ncbi:MAG: hypothetical protein NVSMB66_2510 [Candidatus Doudnabacteria bacterium]